MLLLLKYWICLSTLYAGCFYNGKITVGEKIDINWFVNHSLLIKLLMQVRVLCLVSCSFLNKLILENGSLLCSMQFMIKKRSKYSSIGRIVCQINKTDKYWPNNLWNELALSRKYNSIAKIFLLTNICIMFIMKGIHDITRK